MSIYKLTEESSLGDYYRVFVMVWPALFLVPFFVLLYLVLRMPLLTFFKVYFLSCGVSVAVGAPLLHWARKRSAFVKDPRPVILASGLTFLAGTTPVVYFLARPIGFDPFAAFLTLLIAVVPLALLYFRPPKKLYERLLSRENKSRSD